MATTRTIHVVGTGTIGEPLLGLLLHTQRALDVDAMTFHKHSPRLGDRANLPCLFSPSPLASLHRKDGHLTCGHHLPLELRSSLPSFCNVGQVVPDPI
jgi:hypothetical protein